MSIFQVKDWDVPSGPVMDGSKNLKKRKRPQHDTKDLEVAETNVNELMKIVEKGTLNAKSQKKKQRQGHEKDGEVASSLSNQPRAKKHDKKKGKAAKYDKPDTPSSSPNKPIKNADSNADSSVETTTTISQVNRNKKKEGNKPKDKAAEPTERLTSLQVNMKGSLEGARFRFINEVLYTTDSAEGHKLMQDDPRVFEEYHSGFRQQVKSWPSNPVNHYISILSSYPKSTVIADLGCGEAMLARTLVPKGHCVLSYDLVSDNGYILEADVCKRIPLPGSEDPPEGQIVDVCVCALSLMSLDWIGCIKEIWRVLKKGGELKIAEVTSRIIEAEKFIGIITALGFKLKKQDDSNSHFMLFDFQKFDRPPLTEKKWERIQAKHDVLKPCEYKRR